MLNVGIGKLGLIFLTLSCFGKVPDHRFSLLISETTPIEECAGKALKFFINICTISLQLQILQINLILLKKPVFFHKQGKQIKRIVLHYRVCTDADYFEKMHAPKHKMK